MKVFVLNPQHLALAWLPALIALDQGLLRGVVLRILRMSHCKEKIH